MPMSHQLLPDVSNMTKDSKKNTGKARKARNAKKNKSNRNQKGATALANALLDPCGAPTQHIYGTDEGYLATTRQSFDVSSCTNGYVVWFPGHHGNSFQDSPDVPGACYYYNTNAIGTAPVNTGANPTGSGGIAGDWVRTPGFDLINSTSVTDGRLVGGCIKLTPTSTISSITGRIGILEDVPIEAIFSGGAGRTPGNVWNYASSTLRCPAEEVEVKMRPNADTAVFRNTLQPPTLFCNKGTRPRTPLSYYGLAAGPGT